MNYNDELRDVILYLDAVQDLYPGGIPENFLQEDRTKEVRPAPAAAANITFVTDIFDAADADYLCAFSGPAGELLAAAITKGLKLDPKCARLLTLFRDAAENDAAGATRARRRDAIAGELQKGPAGVVVLLGKSVSETFFSGESFDDLRSNWRTIGELPALITHDLNDVLKSPAVKKQFWLDLQQVLSRT